MVEVMARHQMFEVMARHRVFERGAIHRVFERVATPKARTLREMPWCRGLFALWLEYRGGWKT